MEVTTLDEMMNAVYNDADIIIIKGKALKFVRDHMEIVKHQLDAFTRLEVKNNGINTLHDFSAGVSSAFELLGAKRSKEHEMYDQVQEMFRLIKTYYTVSDSGNSFIRIMHTGGSDSDARYSHSGNY